MAAGDGPSWHAATAFLTAYVGAIWPALVVAVVLSACVQAFRPRSWLARLLNRRRAVTSAAAGAAAGRGAGRGGLIVAATGHQGERECQHGGGGQEMRKLAVGGG